MQIHSMIRFFFSWYADHRDLHSFPTRRSSDLDRIGDKRTLAIGASLLPLGVLPLFLWLDASRQETDRKSTRLNSSHVAISYAVFCLKKKKKKKTNNE